MSDPMTNTEVEDVLSSIRRLVSDEKRLEPSPKPEPASDRLVLTPSLRVMDDAAQQSDAAADILPSDNLAAHTLTHGNVAPDDGNEWVDIAEAFADDVETAGHDDAAEIAQRDPLVLRSEAEAPEKGVEGVANDDPWHDQNAAFSETAGDGRDDADHDTNDDAHHEADDAHDHDNQDTDHDEHTGDNSGTARVPAETLSEKIAALETLIAGRVDQWEPDQAGTDAYAGTEPPAMAWEDAEDDVLQDDAVKAAFAPHVEAHVEAAAIASEPDTPFMSNDEDILDEEALRELVSDIVREELQGALGERITRNVRKLVRREIHRALAAQDLE
jgi:hypothetical protein